MEFKHEANKFYLGESPDKTLAEISYSRGNTTIIIDHTHVSEELGGQGVGRKLVDAVTQWAREEGLKVMPLCPYAKRVMESDSKYHDILL